MEAYTVNFPIYCIHTYYIHIHIFFAPVKFFRGEKAIVGSLDALDGRWHIENSMFSSMTEQSFKLSFTLSDVLKYVKVKYYWVNFGLLDSDCELTHLHLRFMVV